MLNLVSCSFAFLFVYPYFIYPTLVYLISILFPKNIKIDPNYLPHLTLLISAYNEEREIAEKLENTLSLDYPPEKLEIVVASESTDGTNEIVKEYVERFPGRVLLKPFQGRQGKSYTIFRCVPEIKGEVVVFSDANALYKKNALKVLASHFKDQRVGHVSGSLQYAGEKTNSDENFYWGYERTIYKAEGRLGVLPIANGAIFAVRKDYFNPLTPYRCDDGELPMGAILKGGLSVYAEDAIALEPASSSNRHEFNRRRRIAGWNFVSTARLMRVALAQKKILLLWIIASHKLLRWFTPLWAIGLFITSALAIHTFPFSLVFFACLFILGMAGAGLFMERLNLPKYRVLSIPYFFVGSQLAMLIGVAWDSPKRFKSDIPDRWQKLR